MYGHPKKPGGLGHPRLARWGTGRTLVILGRTGQRILTVCSGGVLAIAFVLVITYVPEEPGEISPNPAVEAVQHG